MTRFVSSTVAAISRDMLDLGCHPLVVTEVCEELGNQPARNQVVFLDRLEKEKIDDIAKDLGVSHKTIQRIIHGRLTCVASLLDHSVQ
jgi:hypothetical protein